MNLAARIFATCWAMDLATMDQVLAVVERHDAGERLTAEQITAAIGRPPETPHPRDRRYTVHQSVAIVPIQGVLAKHASAIDSISMPSGTSYDELCADLRTAVADPEVRGIMLHVESGGGVVDGGDAAIAAIRAAGEVKPVETHFDGIGASMAYRLGMFARKVTANRSTITGSIGVIWPTRDSKAALEKSGERRRYIRSGPLKAPGQPGEDWNDEQLAARQRMVDQMAAQFFADLGEARSLTGDALAKVTSGDAWLAEQALSLGLIDEVTSFDDHLSAFVHALAPRSSTAAPRRPAGSVTSPTTAGITMSIAPDQVHALITKHPAHAPMISKMAAGIDAPKPSTQAEITAAIAAADRAAADQAVVAERDDLKAKLAAAGTAHEAAIAAKDVELTAARAEIEALKAAAELNKPKGAKALEGLPPVAPPATGALAVYSAKKAELVAAGDKTPSATIARKFPAINQAMIDEVNANKSLKQEKRS